MATKYTILDEIDTTFVPYGGRFDDLTAREYGRLKVTGFCGVRRTKSDNKTYYWWCDCSCGTKQLPICRNNLVMNHTTSCGCVASEVTTKRNTTHGHDRRGKRSSEYVTYVSMKTRCTNPQSDDYDNYGGRGITICDRWLDDKTGFENFLLDMGLRPAKLSLGRRDNDGPYSPDNCRWETPLQQGGNKRNSRILEHGGRKMHMAAWARELGLNPTSLSERIEKWGLEKALSTPKKVWG